MVQDVLRAGGRPQGEKVVIRIGERSPPADGHESRVTDLGEDHNGRRLFRFAVPCKQSSEGRTDVTRLRPSAVRIGMDTLEVDATAQRPLLLAAAASALLVAVSIISANIIGELPEALWFIFVPVGMLGGAVTCVTCLALAFVRRPRKSGLQSP